jgi:hypothetical protein
MHVPVVHQGNKGNEESCRAPRVRAINLLPGGAFTTPPDGQWRFEYLHAPIPALSASWTNWQWLTDFTLPTTPVGRSNIQVPRRPGKWSRARGPRSLLRPRTGARRGKLCHGLGNMAGESLQLAWSARVRILSGAIAIEWTGTMGKSCLRLSRGAKQIALWRLADREESSIYESLHLASGVGDCLMGRG